MTPNLDTRTVIEAKTIARDAVYRSEVATWTPLATVWAEVRDVLPSRAEATQQGLTQARNQTRVRIRYRTDVNSSMRLRFGNGRLLQIIGGPAEIGRHEWLEMLCEEYTT